MTEPLTTVVFRIYPGANNRDVIALMPELPADHRGHITCYQHVGQHGAADYARVLADTLPAMEPDYRALKRELEGPPYGYRLRVVKRYRRKRG